MTIFVFADRFYNNSEYIMTIYNQDGTGILINSYLEKNEPQVQLTTFNSNITATRICTQTERKRHIRTMCSKPWMKTSHKVTFLVDDEHRIAYCFIPKIASSTWNTILMTSTRKGRRLRIPKGAHHPVEIRKRGLRMSGLTDRIRKYTKFMIMRNPIDRFQSAYYDKIYRPITKKTPHFGFLKWMRNTVRRATHSRRNGTGGSPKFRNFVNFMLNTRGYRRAKEDKHWARFASRCDPCRIK